MRTFASLLILALASGALPGPAFAAEPALAGKWDCTSTGPDGADYPWTLTIKVDEGKITGMAGSQQGETPILEPKLEGSTLTFKQKIGSEGNFTLTLKFSGETFEGTFSGEWAGTAVDGKVKGKKQS